MRFAKRILVIATAFSFNIKAEITFFPEFEIDRSDQKSGEKITVQRLDGNHDWKIRSDDGTYLDIPAKVCLYEYK
jgi:hypothetical protein